MEREKVNGMGYYLRSCLGVLAIIGILLKMPVVDVEAQIFYSYPEQKTITFSKEQRRELERKAAETQYDDELSSEQFGVDSVLDKNNIWVTELDGTPVRANISISSDVLNMKLTVPSRQEGDMLVYALYEYQYNSETDSVTLVQTGTSQASYFDNSHVAIGSMDFAGKASKTYMAYYFLEDEVGGFVSCCSVAINKTQSGISLCSMFGEKEFDFYKKLVTNESPEKYNDIPELYYTVDSDSYYYVGDQMDDIVEKAEQLTAGCSTDEQKVRVIHDWIAKNFAYDSEYLYYVSIDREYEKPYKLTSAPYYTYQSKTAVCAGYARLNQLMLTSLGIPCINVMGCGEGGLAQYSEYTPELNHEWNVVYLNGEWYLMDLTWDSPNKYLGENNEDNVIGQDAKYNYYSITPYAFGGTHYSMEITKSYYISELSFSVTPSKVTFDKGEEFSTDAVITGKLSNGSKKGYYPFEYTCSGYDANTLGKQTITIFYAGKTLTYEITVVCPHNETDYRVTKEPTCYQKGVLEEYCLECDEGVAQEDIQATGDHHYGDWMVIKEPTCYQKGTQKHVCNQEGCSAFETEPIKATGKHSYGEYIVEKEPSCYEQGVKVRNCQTEGCSSQERVILSATEKHILGAWEEYFAPSCVNPGQNVAYCQTPGCDYLEYQAVKATGKHIFETYETIKVPNCMETGVERAFCETIACSAVDERVLPKTKVHTMGEWMLSELPTCYEEGVEKRSCKISGCVYEEERDVKPTGFHSYGIWQTTKAPTCYQEGERQRFCEQSGCPSFETDVLEVTGYHLYGDFETIVKPTCVKDGLERRFCQTKGCTAREDNILEKTDIHTLGDWIDIKEPSCYQAGETARFCQTEGCDYSVKEEIPATEVHVRGNWSIYKMPTCIHKGEERSWCQTNGCQFYLSCDIPATGEHVFGEYNIITPANCMTSGLKRAVCQTEGCNETDDQLIPVTDVHTMGDWVVAEQPTYENKGLRRRVCQITGCPVVLEEEIAKLMPTQAPTAIPTASPTAVPTIVPTQAPTAKPNVVEKIDAVVGNVACKVTVDQKNKQVALEKNTDNKVSVVNIPATVKVEGKSLKVTTIKDTAFAGNSKLKTVVIGKNITTLGNKIFYNCKSLKTITIKSTKLTEKTVAKNAFKGIKKSTTVKVPKKKLNAYKKLFKKKGLSSKVKMIGV